MTYSEVTDLIVGTDMPLPSSPTPDKFIQDACDEIDGKLGMRYTTPIVVDETNPAVRATALILRRICNYLASGMIILAQSTASEQQQLHAYGADLVKQARTVLEDLANGRIILPGATTLNADDQGRSGPLINNLDAQSNVESFYGMVTNPPTIPWNTAPVFPAGTPIRIPYTW